MPAKSKSQQRLFGMIHAYKHGKLHADKKTQKMIGRIADRISDEDARHFAETSHVGLPEKKASDVYEPPYSEEQMLAAGYRKELVKRLIKDAVHGWRARTGIELMHKEPSKEEFERVWKNWNLMSPEQKALSDRKSKELFGIDNAATYDKLKSTY